MSPALSPMIVDYFDAEGFMHFGQSYIRRNWDKLKRPFENHGFSAGFVFSYGHLLLNAGYDSNYNYVYHWEEQYQRYLAWKAGYTVYTPRNFFLWHLWDRRYRPEFEDDFENEKIEEKKIKELL